LRSWREEPPVSARVGQEERHSVKILTQHQCPSGEQILVIEEQEDKSISIGTEEKELTETRPEEDTLIP